MEAKPTAREILSRELMKIFAQTHSRVRMIDPVRGWTDHKFLEPHDQKFFTVFNGDRPSDLNLCCARSGWGYEVRVRIECGDFTQGEDPRGAGPIRLSMEELESWPQLCAHKVIHDLEARTRLANAN